MKKNVLILLISFIVFYSCNNTETTNFEEISEPQVYVTDGMFVFQSNEHIVAEMQKLNKLSFEKREQWFEKFGITTFGSVFTKVMLAEDSISNYFESLPSEEQDYYRSKPQIFSDLYKSALDNGIIKIVRESNSSYFDINLYDKTYADFINLDGKIKIGNNLYQISECETKIYTGVNDKDLKDLTGLKPLIISRETEDNLKSVQASDWSEVKSPIYYDNNWLGNPRKKVWAEMLGESYMNISFEDETTSCCRSVYSNFVLKGFAQKKNFWGNFVFSGDFNPLIEMEGSWDYQYVYWNYDYDPNDSCLCGYYSSQKTYGYNDFPNYYCTPIHTNYCPTSPIDMSLYGNGWQPSVSPTGIFSYTVADGLWWARAFRVYNIDITITIDEYDFNFN